MGGEGTQGVPGEGDGGGVMYVVCVTVHVAPEHVESFIQATLENARESRKEPGNVRFDVLQAEADPAQFFLYEVYRE